MPSHSNRPAPPCQTGRPGKGAGSGFTAGRTCPRRRRSAPFFALVFAFLAGLAPAAAGERLAVSAFEAEGLGLWKEKVFKGKTRYDLVNMKNGTVLRARSRGTASGLYRKMRVDLTKTPYLNWRWRVEGLLQGNDERTKAGDDYPARVYVVVSGGLFFWRTRAINYVWSSHQPAGSAWPNAYTANAHMIAVRSGPVAPGVWQREKRNVREDFKRAFGIDLREAHAVAIMTDTDNTGQSATAYYGDLYFSSE